MKLLAFSAVLLFWNFSWGQAKPKTLNTSTSGGRFQLIQLSEMRRDQHLLDTQTGQIWERVCFISNPSDNASCQYGAWTKEDIEGVNLSMQQILDKAIRLEKNQKNPKNGGSE